MRYLSAWCHKQRLNNILKIKDNKTDPKGSALPFKFGENIVDCVREFVNIDEESALVDLFRMHLVDDVEAFTEILQILPNSMALAKAYLLNESDKLKLDDLSC